MIGKLIENPVSDRIARMRRRFKAVEGRDIYIDAQRTQIITESYKAHEAYHPLLKRAWFFYDLCAGMTVRVEDDELIVGNQGRTYRSIPAFVDWYEERLFRSVEVDDETFRRTWQAEICRNKMTDEDRAIFLEVGEYWKNRNIAVVSTTAMPPKVKELHGTGVFKYNDFAGFDGMVTTRPEGHFCANTDKVVHKGMRAIREEAEAKMAEIEGRCFGDSADQYIFYQSLVLVCDAMILLTKRYGVKCLEKAETAAEPRKSELLSMGNSLNHIIEYPCRTYWEAMQATNFYQLCLTIDGQNHGLSFGRVDQFVGHFLEDELKKGETTIKFAQEIADSFILKAAEYTTPTVPAGVIEDDVTRTFGGYSTGQHFTVGGVNKDGTNACNTATELLLQGYLRLNMDSPSVSLRIDKDTPNTVWAIALESSKRSGGMPTFENDDVIIPALMHKGFMLEDARNYAIIGCVELAGCGNDWSCCGANGMEAFWNFPAVMVLALNNGLNPLTGKGCGPSSGYLYEMETFEQLQDALVAQANYYLDWQVTCTNICESVYRLIYPCPLASATIDGCIESGKDVTWGGAQYNSTGLTCCGIGNVADSLAAVKYLCFDRKICTTRQLYDALMANWAGYETLRETIKNIVPHYGNDDAYVDGLAKWAMHIFSDRINAATGPRGKWRPGTFTMTMHLTFGSVTAATPDGRKNYEPLAEAISSRQGYDTNGPTAYIKSAAQLSQIELGNGDQLNIKFSPSAVAGAEGMTKVRSMIESYFDMGGMQVQFNVVDTDILHEAQARPEEFKELVVRIAGFSAHFVEMDKTLQDDFISRTEHIV